MHHNCGDRTGWTMRDCLVCLYHHFQARIVDCHFTMLKQLYCREITKKRMFLKRICFFAKNWHDWTDKTVSILEFFKQSQFDKEMKKN